MNHTHSELNKKKSANSNEHVQCILGTAEVAGLKALIGEKQEDYEETIKIIDQVEKIATPHAQVGATALESVKGLFVTSKISILDFQKTGGTPLLAGAVLIKAVFHLLDHCKYQKLSVNAFSLKLLQLRFGSYVKGGYNLRRSWKIYEEMLTAYNNAAPEEISSLEPSFLCALEFGVGAFQFIISLVPKSFQTIIEAIGFKADRLAGIEHLKKAQTLKGLNGNFFSAENI